MLRSLYRCSSLLIRRPICTSDCRSGFTKSTQKNKTNTLLLKRPENRTQESKAFSLSRSQLEALASDELEESEEEEEEKIDLLLAQYTKNSSNGDEYDWSAVMNLINSKLPMAPKVPLEAKEDILQASITCNLAKVINDHPTLQRLVDLGVDLVRWENIGAADLALTLDFERDVKPRLLVLHKYGVKAHFWAHMLTFRPQLLREEICNLETRFEYLLSRGFSGSTASSMVVSSPSWLTLSVTEIDGRLAFFKSHFSLTDKEVRHVASVCPRLITWSGVSMQVQLNCYVLKDNLGLTSGQMKTVLKACPKVFMTQSTHTLNRMIDFLRDEVGYDVQLILRFPEVLTQSWTSKFGRLKYLKFLKRDQFDPSKPCYVSPLALMMPDDQTFCTEVAKTDISTFYQFLKTI